MNNSRIIKWALEIKNQMFKRKVDYITWDELQQHGYNMQFVQDLKRHTNYLWSRW